ncbi:hypothetical protein [Microbacterium sp. EST19A]|uniref:hypothetical protein n=1 Tax=Microbacterium sp. EST19A TaxID=2862681 RepID=UPI001CBB8BF5|nr:hypothetical protein [Microbacterium sp. EST19A]
MSGGDERLDPVFRARLKETLVAQAAGDDGSMRRGPRIAWALVAGVCLVAGAGAAWVLAGPGAESVAGGLELRSVEVVCATVAGPINSASATGGALTEPRDVTISVAIAGETDPSPALIDGCMRLWDEGLLAGVEFQSSSPQSGADDVPALTLCSLPDGAPVVIPASDCRAAGMTEWSDADRPAS